LLSALVLQFSILHFMRISSIRLKTRMNL
jgi:hypothetical protein